MRGMMFVALMSDKFPKEMNLMRCALFPRPYSAPRVTAEHPTMHHTARYHSSHPVLTYFVLIYPSPILLN
jgi:hypothetical protein